MHMKHAILGAGAIGGLVGTALASLGEDVTMIVRPQKLADYPRKLTLERPSGAITGPVKAVSKLTESMDVLWVATRTFHLGAALEAAHTSHTMVVPLLNGVEHVGVLRTRFGQEHVFPATIAVEAEQLAPGHFIQRSPMVRLNLVASAEPVLGAIVARLREIGFTCEFVANERTLLWSKLCFLAPFALVTSASGKNKGEVFADPQWKAKLLAAVAEACAVANASGAEIDPAKIQALFDGFPPTVRSSMAKDVAARRPLELDGIAGPIVRGAERYGIAVPVIKGLMETIRAQQ